MYAPTRHCALCITNHADTHYVCYKLIKLDDIKIRNRDQMVRC